MVEKIEKAGTASGKPLRPVKIVDCGEVEGSKIPSAIEKEKGNSRVYIRCKNSLANTYCI